MNFRTILIFLILLFIIFPTAALAAPRPFGSDINSQTFIDQHYKDRALNPVEGIWTVNAQGIEADIAIIRNTTGKYTEYEYVGIILQTNSHYWKKGEIRLLLRGTPNPSYYKATWLIVGLFWQDTKYASSLVLSSGTTFESTLVGEYNTTIRTTAVRLYPSTATPSRPSIAYGTGFFITPNAIVTNAHVVNEFTKITAIFQGKITRPATLLAIDKDNDVAILSVDTIGGEVSPLFVANSNSVVVGEKAYTLGYPVPEAQGYNGKFTDGMINSITGFGDHPRWFQVSTPIQPGNSGGPLLDSKGRVVGITSASASVIYYYKLTGSFPQNGNLAVKSNYILNMMVGLSEGAKLLKDEPSKPLEPAQIAEIAGQAVVLIKSE